MRTVPLHGKKAAGRVALVDDEDYDLVMQYHWNVYEKPATATRRANGPYAIANAGYGRSDRRTARMHNLIMDRPYIDHIDHYGLNNQKSNLRPATYSQNGANQRPQEGRTSSYKGVFWIKRENVWGALIKVHGKGRRLGQFLSEIEAAYAYDAAARAAFGEYACPNFPDGPTQAMRDEWQAGQAAHDAVVAAGAAERERVRKAAQQEWWDQREPEPRICGECGKEYRSRSTRSSFCSKACGWINWNNRRLERESDGRLF